MSKQSRKRWCCLNCSQRSARHWNLEVHIKRWHNGIGEPINEEELKEFKDKKSNQFFYHKHPYSVNDLSLRSGKGKEKEQDIIDIMHKIVIEHKEKLRKVKEIKSFFYELTSLSSSFFSSQQPVTITSLIQTPIIQPIIPPPVTTTAPLQPAPLQPTQSSEEQVQKNEKIINPGTDLFTNLFITSTLIVPEIVRRLRGVGKGGEDSIIIPREPSLSPYMMTSTFNNNNNSKKREEKNLLTENTNKEEPREESHDIQEYSLSRHNLLIDNEDDYVIDNNTDYDDSINIDNNYDYSNDVSLVIKRDDHGDIYE
jgi:hypothetical protein